MAMSDCERCWETPCSCGWDLRNKSIELLERRKALLSTVIEFKKANPSAKFSIPYRGPRTEDDELFMRFCESKEGAKK